MFRPKAFVLGALAFLVSALAFVLGALAFLVSALRTGWDDLTLAIAPAQPDAIASLK